MVVNDEKLFMIMRIFYMSFLFYPVKFYTNNENLKSYVYVLNIKSRKKRIKYIYDSCCEEIDNYFKDTNPCGFCHSKCLMGHKMGCCRYCRYVSDTGCTTSNLACKLFFCSAVTKNIRVLQVSDLPLYKMFSFKNRVIVKSDFFRKEEDVLKDLYTFTFTLATIRVLLGIMKNFMAKKKYS